MNEVPLDCNKYKFEKCFFILILNHSNPKHQIVKHLKVSHLVTLEFNATFNAVSCPLCLADKKPNLLCLEIKTRRSRR